MSARAVLSVVFLIASIGFGCKQSEERTGETLAVTQPAGITAADVPPDAELKGRFAQGMKWQDGSGEHVVILSETGGIAGEESDEFGETQSAELRAQHLLKAGDSYVAYWTIDDAVRDCPFDIIARFREGSLSVTDLDNDGTAEVWFIYVKHCTSDVSPGDLKLIMYEGKTEYTMYGQTKVDLGNGEMQGGNYTMDYALMNGPREFLDYGIKLWQRHVLETW